MQERGNLPSCVKRPARRAMPDRGSPRCSRLLILAMANIYSFSNVPAATGLRPGSGRVRSPRGAAPVGSADVAAVELIGGLIVAGTDRLLVPEWNSQARCIGRRTRDMAGACGDAVREGPGWPGVRPAWTRRVSALLSIHRHEIGRAGWTGDVLVLCRCTCRPCGRGRLGGYGFSK